MTKQNKLCLACMLIFAVVSVMVEGLERGVFLAVAVLFGILFVSGEER